MSGSAGSTTVSIGLASLHSNVAELLNTEVSYIRPVGKSMFSPYEILKFISSSDVQRLRGRGCRIKCLRLQSRAALPLPPHPQSRHRFRLPCSIHASFQAIRFMPSWLDSFQASSSVRSFVASSSFGSAGEDYAGWRRPKEIAGTAT